MKKISKLALVIITLMVFVGCNQVKQDEAREFQNQQEDKLQDVEEINDNSKENADKEKSTIKQEDVKVDEDIDKSVDNLKENDVESKESTSNIEQKEEVNKEYDVEKTKEIIKSNNVSTESTLSNKTLNWYSGRKSNHIAPPGNQSIDITKYNGFYVGNTDEKVIYLTFDNGYENGFTPKILDTLKKHQVKATFFVTLPFIKSNPDLVKRMKAEGHCVGNHTNTHPSLPTISDEQIKNEITQTENFMKENTGYSIDPFFRPPAGAYSERTLDLTQKLGYATIFWSLAFKDWDINNQPGSKFSYDYVMQNYHPGAIPLLHAVSSSNAEALDDILTSLKEEGYRFASLYELIDDQQEDKGNITDEVSTTQSNIKEIIND